MFGVDFQCHDSSPLKKNLRHLMRHQLGYDGFVWYLQVPWVISGFLPLKRHNHVHCSLVETLGKFNSLFLPGDII